jgi:hypothetical protein
MRNELDTDLAEARLAAAAALQRTPGAAAEVRPALENARSDLEARRATGRLTARGWALLSECRRRLRP